MVASRRGGLVAAALLLFATGCAGRITADLTHVMNSWSATSAQGRQAAETDTVTVELVLTYELDNTTVTADDESFTVMQRVALSSQGIEGLNISRGTDVSTYPKEHIPFTFVDVPPGQFTTVQYTLPASDVLQRVAITYTLNGMSCTHAMEDASGETQPERNYIFASWLCDWSGQQCSDDGCVILRSVDKVRYAIMMPEVGNGFGEIAFAHTTDVFTSTTEGVTTFFATFEAPPVDFFISWMSKTKFSKSCVTDACAKSTVATWAFYVGPALAVVCVCVCLRCYCCRKEAAKEEDTLSAKELGVDNWGRHGRWGELEKGDGGRGRGKMKGSGRRRSKGAGVNAAGDEDGEEEASDAMREIRSRMRADSAVRRRSEGTGVFDESLDLAVQEDDGGPTGSRQHQQQRRLKKGEGSGSAAAIKPAAKEEGRREEWFGSEERDAQGMGADDDASLRKAVKAKAKQPKPSNPTVQSLGAPPPMPGPPTAPSPYMLSSDSEDDDDSSDEGGGGGGGRAIPDSHFGADSLPEKAVDSASPSRASPKTGHGTGSSSVAAQALQRTPSIPGSSVSMQLRKEPSTSSPIDKSPTTAGFGRLGIPPTAPSPAMAQPTAALKPSPAAAGAKPKTAGKPTAGYVIEGSPGASYVKNTGLFVQVEGLSVNSRPIYHHEARDKALYLNNEGRWIVSSKAGAELGDTKGHLYVKDLAHAATAAELDSRQWKCFDSAKKTWVIDPAIRVIPAPGIPPLKVARKALPIPKNVDTPMSPKPSPQPSFRDDGLSKVLPPTAPPPQVKAASPKRKSLHCLIGCDEETLGKLVECAGFEKGWFGDDCSACGCSEELHNKYEAKR